MLLGHKLVTHLNSIILLNVKMLNALLMKVILINVYCAYVVLVNVVIEQERIILFGLFISQEENEELLIWSQVLESYRDGTAVCRDCYRSPCQPGANVIKLFFLVTYRSK
jgi:hypothetical protein